MLSAKEKISVSESLAVALGLPAADHGGLLCVDDDGQRVTLLGDPGATEMIALASTHRHGTLDVHPKLFPLVIAGWPDEWAG